MEYYEASKFFFLTLLKILLLKVYLHALPMCTKDFLQMFIVKCSFPTNEVILIVQPTLENKFIKKKKTGISFNCSGGTGSVMILQLLLY